MVVFWGDFQSRQRYSLTPEPKTIELTLPENFDAFEPEAIDQMTFHPHVCRLMLGGDRGGLPVFIHDIEMDKVRPPNADELPKLRYLAYGTSITQGVAATGPHLTYVAQVAQRLGADVINLGMGGSAYCEPEFADYIVERDDWDIATLALSLNMLSPFSVDEFYERVSYMVNTVAGANTQRPVLCITLYPYRAEIVQNLDERREKGQMFRQKLRDAVANCPHPNVHLAEGPNLLTNIGGLTTDLVHPGDYAMIEMADNVAGRLQELL